MGANHFFVSHWLLFLFFFLQIKSPKVLINSYVYSYDFLLSSDKFSFIKPSTIKIVVNVDNLLLFITCSSLSRNQLLQFKIRHKYFHKYFIINFCSTCSWLSTESIVAIQKSGTALATTDLDQAFSIPFVSSSAYIYIQRRMFYRIDYLFNPKSLFA